MSPLEALYCCPIITEGMCTRLLAVAVTDARTTNDNTDFAEAFERVLGTSEVDRVSLVETVWE
jgi:hypothetical protein